MTRKNTLPIAAMALGLAIPAMLPASASAFGTAGTGLQPLFTAIPGFDADEFARRGRGADDGPGHQRRGRGTDDGPGHDAGDDKGGSGGGHGADDGPGHT